eukprot:1645246-Prymnesium_polylepis.2
MGERPQRSIADVLMACGSGLWQHDSGSATLTSPVCQSRDATAGSLSGHCVACACRQRCLLYTSDAADDM